MFLCALDGTPSLLPNAMEGQLASVRQNILSVQQQIVKYEQKLAAAERAGNKGVEEEVRFLRGQLLSLNNQLSGLQEEKNILLRGGVAQVSGCEAFAMSHMHRQTPLACVKDGIPASRLEV